jgi:hypothetical protein
VRRLLVVGRRRRIAGLLWWWWVVVTGLVRPLTRAVRTRFRTVFWHWQARMNWGADAEGPSRSSVECLLFLLHDAQPNIMPTCELDRGPFRLLPSDLARSFGSSRRARTNRRRGRRLERGKDDAGADSMSNAVVFEGGLVAVVPRMCEWEERERESVCVCVSGSLGQK